LTSDIADAVDHKRRRSLWGLSLALAVFGRGDKFCAFLQAQVSGMTAKVPDMFC
jgi:hypothetical protein